MLVHVPSVPYSLPVTAFARCEQLFSSYPLAVNDDCARGSRSMVLMDRAAAGGFFILSQACDGLFAIRPWSRQEAVQDVVQVIADGMPIPCDGAMLGWVADRQVTAMLSVHSGHPPTSGAVVPDPEIRVLPMTGIGELDWPPFTTDPFGDGRLWDYLERGEIVDIIPLLSRSAGHAFLVPSPYGHSPTRGARCVVVTENLQAEEYWLPAGVYMHHWLLCEGVPAPPASQLLALPDTVGLPHKHPLPR